MKNLLVQSLLLILSYIIPKKKNLIIFGAGDAKQFQGNPKYIYQFLRSNPYKTISYFWSAKSKKQQDFLKKINAPFIDPYTLSGFFKILRAQYMVIEKSTFDVYYTKMIFGRFNFIQTWHGTPLKHIGIDKDNSASGPAVLTDKNNSGYKFLKRIKFFTRQKFKLITAPSEEIKTLFQNVFENRNVAVTGYARNDVIFNPALAVSDYGRILNLKAYAKTILFAPTFRDDTDTLSPLSDSLMEFNRDLKQKNYLFLVKKHPWQKNFHIPENLSHIIDVSGEIDDIQELYPHVDILINDYSSAFFDFMLSKKPVIFYPYDLENYLENCRGMYLDYYKDLPGPFAQNEPELFSLIFSVEEWQNDTAYQARYDHLLRRYNLYIDGHSSERVLKLLFPDSEVFR
ncbi:MAG TPA: CDP-glycerol glycerophosphotransferase family protein [Edaphocola sp.]|nr:CDP-glycerol glycerophosphotransferase family protein [Edaphocola sp.]